MTNKLIETENLTVSYFASKLAASANVLEPSELFFLFTY